MAKKKVEKVVSKKMLRMPELKRFGLSTLKSQLENIEKKEALKRPFDAKYKACLVSEIEYREKLRKQKDKK